ncbi:hypothetical protein HDV00_003694 [Rhizophlyctis rosea]|nr:hypothetical protein HDV00_003694 [Rhizophlyctis rosea]
MSSGFAEIEADNEELVPRDDLNDPPGKFSWNPMDWWKEFYSDFKTGTWKVTEKRRVLLRAVFGEGLCTFLFLFIVEATSVNNSRQETPENLTLACVSTAFCSIALIYSFADVSGAHFNPAVTFATIVTGKVSLRKGLAFWAIQLFAAIWSTIALYIVFPNAPKGYNNIAESVVVNVSDDSHLLNAFCMEIMMTFVLVYVIFATAFDTVDTGNNIKVKEKGEGGGDADRSIGKSLTIYTTSGNTKAGFAPFAIGFTLGFLGLIGGSVSGAAYNPARVFGPAIISGKWDNNWIYWIGDFIGAGLAGWAQHFFAHEAQQTSGASAKSKQGARQEQQEALKMNEIEQRA